MPLDSEVYAKCFRDDSSGHALYDAVSGTNMKPGTCGYFDSTHSWVPIAHLLDQNSARSIGAKEIGSVKVDIFKGHEWHGAKMSVGVSQLSVMTETKGSIPGTGISAGLDAEPCPRLVRFDPVRLLLPTTLNLWLNCSIRVINVREKDPQDVLVRLLEYYATKIHYQMSVLRFNVAVQELQYTKYRTRLRPAIGIETVTNFRACITDYRPGDLSLQSMFALYYAVSEVLRSIYRVGLRTSRLHKSSKKMMELPIIDKALFLYQKGVDRIIVAEDGIKRKRSWADILDDDCANNLQVMADRACRWWDAMLNSIELGAEELVAARTWHETPRLLKSSSDIGQCDVWGGLSVLRVCLRDCIDCMERNRDTIDMIRTLNSTDITPATTDELHRALKRACSIDRGLRQDMESTWNRYQTSRQWADSFMATGSLQLAFYTHQSLQTCTILILVFLPAMFVSSIFGTGMLQELKLSQIWILFVVIVSLTSVTFLTNSLWSRWYSGFGPLQGSKFEQDWKLVPPEATC